MLYAPTASAFQMLLPSLYLDDTITKFKTFSDPGDIANHNRNDVMLLTVPCNIVCDLMQVVVNTVPFLLMQRMCMI